MNILRRIAATFAGLISGGVAVGVIEGLSSFLHPAPAGLDTLDEQALREWIATLPASAFILVALAWTVGSLVGAFVARRLAPQRSAWPAAIVVLLLLLATLFNLLTLPHPFWMWPAGIAGCLIGGMYGCTLAAPRSYAIATTRLIEAPLETVFQTISNIEEFSQAVPQIQSIEFLTESRYGVGTRFRETREINGRKATTELEVEDLLENQHIQMVSFAGGTSWDTLFTVTENPESKTVAMHMRMEAIPKSLFAKLMLPLILKMVSRAIEDDMDAVKTYCESK